LHLGGEPVNKGAKSDSLNRSANCDVNALDQLKPTGLVSLVFWIHTLRV
jgi:hypothetical protein